MKTHNKSSIFSLLRSVVVMIILFSACNKDSDNLREYDYLVDHSLLLTYPLAAISPLLSSQITLYPEASDILDHIKYGVQVYRITYKTHYRDSLITASGLACVPVATGSFPVISFQNGTNSSHQNAPSVNPVNSGYAVMEIMASNGYVILIPDYIGFGSSSEILHPYYHRESTSNAVIDLSKAFIEFSASGAIKANSNDSLFLMGYSQGGGATLSVLYEIENNDAIEMNVIAVSGGAGAYNLMDFTEYVLGLENFPGPLYFPYFIYSQQQYGAINGLLNQFFREPYAEKIPLLFDGSYENASINDQLTTHIDDLLTANLLDNFSTGVEFTELREALTLNSLTGWNTSVPVNLYHGTLDDNVPPQQSQNLYNEFIGSGSASGLVQYYPMEGLTHGSGLLPWGIQTINWFNTFRQ